MLLLKYVVLLSLVVSLCGCSTNRSATVRYIGDDQYTENLSLKLVDDNSGIDVNILSNDQKIIEHNCPITFDLFLQDIERLSANHNTEEGVPLEVTTSFSERVYQVHFDGSPFEGKGAQLSPLATIVRESIIAMRRPGQSTGPNWLYDKFKIGSCSAVVKVWPQITVSQFVHFLKDNAKSQTQNSLWEEYWDYFPLLDEWLNSPEKLEQFCAYLDDDSQCVLLSNGKQETVGEFILGLIIIRLGGTAEAKKLLRGVHPDRIRQVLSESQYNPE